MDINVTIGGIPSGYDYFISPDGDDDNPGTYEEPWAITALAGSTKDIASKRIGLLSGTYVLTTTTNRGDGGRYFINITQGGTEETPLVIQSVVPRGAVLTNKSGGVYVDDSTNGGSIFLGYDTADNVQFKELKFFETIGGITMAGNNILVEDCEFSDIDGYEGGQVSNDNLNVVGAWKSSSSSSFATGWIVRNCKFDGVYNMASKEYWSNSCAIGHYGLDDIIIEDCTVSRCGALIYSKDNFGAYTVRRNFVYNTASVFRAAWSGASTQTSLVPSRRNAVYNNVFVPKSNVSHPYARGLFYGDDFFSWIQDTDCYNNTLYQDEFDGSGGLLNFKLGSDTGKQVGTDTKIYNNIFIRIGGTHDLAFRANADSEAPLSYKDALSLMDYNAYSDEQAFVAEDTVAGSGSMNWAAFKADSGFEAGGILVDPLFVTAGGSTPESYQLQGGSPCINAGRVGGVSGGGAVDMGAWAGVSSIGCDF